MITLFAAESELSGDLAAALIGIIGGGCTILVTVLVRLFIKKGPGKDDGMSND